MLTHKALTLGFFPIIFLRNYPTAEDIKKAMFGPRQYMVALYLNSHQDSLVNDGNKVDLHKYGLTKADPILFVDRNNVKGELQEVLSKRMERALVSNLQAGLISFSGVNDTDAMTS
jgi:hypothetical protein